MRLLFSLDKKDYDENGVAYRRPSARCIAIRDGRIMMVHSLKYDYYKFPGGGIEKGETHEEAMIREAREEAGLIVQPETVKEYGYVHRAEKRKMTGAEYFLQENFYYLCQAEDGVEPQELDDYEAEEHFTPEWVTPETVIRVNRYSDHGPKEMTALEREARVMEMLVNEGYFRV